MDSPPNDKCLVLPKVWWFVGCTGCTLQTLYAWFVGVNVFVWLESLFIGSYIYHSDVIAGTQLCY